VPDQPVTSFELELPQGPGCALAANVDLCALARTTITHKTITRRIHGHSKRVRVTVKHTNPGSLGMPTEFKAQNGMEIHQSTPIVVTCCAKAKHPSVAEKRKRKKR
jgi:hypothetical protein